MFGELHCRPIHLCSQSFDVHPKVEKGRAEFTGEVVGAWHLRNSVSALGKGASLASQWRNFLTRKAANALLRGNALERADFSGLPRLKMTTPEQRTVALLEAEQFLCRLAFPRTTQTWNAEAFRDLASAILEHYPRAGDLVEVSFRMPEFLGPPPQLPSFARDDERA